MGSLTLCKFTAAGQKYTRDKRLGSTENIRNNCTYKRNLLHFTHHNGSDREGARTRPAPPWLVLYKQMWRRFLSVKQSRGKKCSCLTSFTLQRYTSLGNSKAVIGPFRQCLKRYFQRETVKKLWLLYRFNKDLTPVWLTTIDPSFCGARSNLESWGAAEPHSLILTQATATAKPAYLHPLKSAGVSVCCYRYVCVCLQRLQTKPNTFAAGSC